MDTKQFSRPDALVERYDYGDRTVTAVDLGPGVEPDVDVVDGTAILVVGDAQREIDLPAGDVRAFNRNGVVTIEVRS